MRIASSVTTSCFVCAVMAFTTRAENASVTTRFSATVVPSRVAS